MNGEIGLPKAKQPKNTMEATIWWPKLPPTSYNVSFCDEAARDESKKEYLGAVKLPRSVINSDDAIPLTIQIKDSGEQPAQIWSAQSSAQQNVRRFATLYTQYCESSPTPKDYVRIALNCKHQCTIRDRENIIVKVPKSDCDQFCKWVDQHPIQEKTSYQKSYFKDFVRQAAYGAFIAAIVFALYQRFGDSIRAYY